MAVKLTREMGITHRDFFRLFPLAAQGFEYQIQNDIVTLHRAHQKLTIKLSAEGERRIALLTLPVTCVEFEFDGFNEREIEYFMERLDRAFQRAGG